MSQVLAYDDFYPFGQQMAGRSFASSADSRYKYTGKERDSAPDTINSGERHPMFSDLLVDGISEFILYRLGYAAAWIVTAGRYPPHPVPEPAKARLQVLGAFVLVLVIAGLALLL